MARLFDPPRDQLVRLTPSISADEERIINCPRRPHRSADVLLDLLSQRPCKYKEENSACGPDRPKNHTGCVTSEEPVDHGPENQVR